MPIVVSVVFLLLVHSVPGALIAVHWRTTWTALRPSGRLAASVGLSSALLLVNGLVLVRLNLFSPGWIWGVAIVEWVVIAVSAGVLAIRSGISFEWVRPTRSSLRFVAASVAGLGAMFGLYVNGFRAGIPQAVSSWRYVLDATDLLAETGIPASSLQWGIERPFAVSKIGGSIWIASIDVLGVWSPLDLVQWAPLAVLAIGVVGTWALFREMTGKWGALAAVMVLFAGYPFVQLFPAKMSRLTIEMIGFGLAVIAVWALVASFRHASYSLRWMAAGMLALTGLTHGVSFLVGAIAMAAYLGGRLLGRESTFRQAAVAGALVVILPAVFVWSGIAVDGQLELDGSTEGYQLVDGTKDPTQALALVIQGNSISDADPPPQGFDPSAAEYAGYLVKRSVARSVPVGRQIAAVYPLALALIVLLLVAGLIILPSERATLIAIGLFGIGIYVLGLLFNLRYDIWIYAQHAIRREYGYFALFVVALVTVLLTGVQRRYASVRVRRSILVVVILVVGTGLYVTAAYQTRWQQPTWRNDEVSAMVWISEQTEPSDLLLLNVRTTGSIGLLADRVALTEGGTPYLFPGLLDHSLRILDGAQGWYREPSQAFLDEYDITYVVGVAGSRRQAIGGNVFVQMDSTERLDAAPFLEEVARFRRIAIYKRR